jgi:hypothetical protein
MNINVNDYVGLTKKDFTVFYDFSNLSTDEKKDNLLLIYNILDSVNTIEEFNASPDKSQITAIELGSIS